VLAGLHGSGKTTSCGARLAAVRMGCAILGLLLPGLTPPRAAANQPAERPGPTISVNPPSDAAVQRRIQDLLSALGAGQLVVEVRSGIVRLGGHAESLAQREQAVGLAERVDGVVLVRNEVEVASDVRGQLGPVWAKARRYLGAALGFLPVLAIAIAAFAAFALFASAVGRWDRLFRRLGLSPLATDIVRIALRALLLVAGIVVALDVLGLSAFVGTVVGAVGLLSVVAGIAFRDVVANHLPGIMLGFSPPFASGDHVRIGQHEGRVVRVTPRETILVGLDGQQLRIPNVRLLQEPIVNLERHRERRLAVTLDVALSADLRRVRDIGRETLLTLPGVLKEPRPFMRALSVGADQVRIAFFAWANQREVSFLDLESRARQAVMEALLAAEVPFPIQEIAVHPPPAPTSRTLDGEEQDERERTLLDAHFREEQAAPGERDLLREGRPRQT
jgi:small-conductance mechanosensitive channel